MQLLCPPLRDNGDLGLLGRLSQMSADMGHAAIVPNSGTYTHPLDSAPHVPLSMLQHTLLLCGCCVVLQLPQTKCCSPHSHSLHPICSTRMRPSWRQEAARSGTDRNLVSPSALWSLVGTNCKTKVPKSSLLLRPAALMASALVRQLPWRRARQILALLSP